MKNKLLAGIATALFSAHATADVLVEASLSGKSKAEIKTVTRYDNNMKCYPLGKGDTVEKYGDQFLQFSSTQVATNQAPATWINTISTPFSRVARTVKLSTSEATVNGVTTITVKLVEAPRETSSRVQVGECWHRNGTVVIKDASIQGKLKVKYKVPENAWALTVQRPLSSGVFDTASPMLGSLNADYDRGEFDGAILWVTPGQIIEQEWTIKDQVPGREELGQVQIGFKAIGHNSTAEGIENFIKTYSTFNRVNLNENESATVFIEQSMALIQMGRLAEPILKRHSILKLKQLSDNLFEIANDVISTSYPKDTKTGIKPDGLSIKTAAALASFQVAKLLMTDLQSYCSDVEVLLPFSGQKQKVLGLRAASFWLSRSMNMVKSYSFAPLETFLLELSQLQASGKTPADIVADKAMSQKILKTYKMLVNSEAFSRSPFDTARVDMNRLVLVFKDLGAIGTRQQDIVAQLSEGSQIEDRFLKDFVTTVLSFRPNRHEMIDLSPLLKSVTDLKRRQAALQKSMSESIRLLSLDVSADQNQLMNQVISVLNRQVAIFSESFDIPFFEPIRKEYVKTNLGNLEQSVQGCFGLGE